MPKVAFETLILFGSTGLLVASLFMIFRPDAVVRRLPEFGEDATPGQARWNTKLGGFVLLLFAWAGFYLVLVEGLKPVAPGDTLNF